MKAAGKSDLIPDVAHVSDHRRTRMDYAPLVEVSSAVSLLLATDEDQRIFEPGELVGSRSRCCLQRAWTQCLQRNCAPSRHVSQ